MHLLTPPDRAPRTPYPACTSSYPLAAPRSSRREPPYLVAVPARRTRSPYPLAVHRLHLVVPARRTTGVPGANRRTSRCSLYLVAVPRRRTCSLTRPRFTDATPARRARPGAVPRPHLGVPAGRTCWGYLPAVPARR
ncbi:hypothetical protein AB0E69_28590 [Kribbella sp. NPDC026611]|uniref:hypothetical protein n=1 Tax=Kribbella sp. NPDC026611 TaxID=3154911 RepID=UPI0033F17B4C